MGNTAKITNVNGSFRAICVVTSMVLFTNAKTLTEAIHRVKGYGYEYYRI